MVGKLTQRFAMLRAVRPWRLAAGGWRPQRDFLPPAGAEVSPETANCSRWQLAVDGRSPPVNCSWQVVNIPLCRLSTCLNRPFGSDFFFHPQYVTYVYILTILISRHKYHKPKRYWSDTQTYTYPFGGPRGVWIFIYLANKNREDLPIPGWFQCIPLQVTIYLHEIQCLSLIYPIV